MKKILILITIIYSPFCYSQLISEYPPYLPSNFRGIPLNGGRCHSIAVHPTNRNIIITSNQFGGLWKTIDGGNTWHHLNGLNAVFTNDVSFGPDGNTVICTRNMDNNVDNGGGIWVSRNGGETWSRPATGRIPSFTRRTTSKGAAFGISYDPDSIGKIFVGTTSGIAISSDNGNSWRHAMLEAASTVNWRDSLQNLVLSVLAYGKNIVFTLTHTGVYKSSNGGLTWTNIKPGDFTFYGSFKLIDIWKNSGAKGGSAGVFILKDYETLLLYEDFTNRWTIIPLPGGGSRGPFVRVSKAATTGYQTVWVGTGVYLRKITKGRLGSFRPGIVTAESWESLGREVGIHDDSGFMGLDGDGYIALYGSDGGIFKPLNTAGTRWTNACIRGSGMNSYQITDIAITNYNLFEDISLSRTSALYFATQDNAIWASADRGVTWPNSDCCEGFHIEVKNQTLASDAGLQVAYGKVGSGPSGNMFSRVFLTDQRMAPTTSTLGIDLGDSILGQAFLIGGDSYCRMRKPIIGNFEGYASDDKGNTWRKRYDYAGISPRGVFHSSRIGVRGPRKLWVPFTAPGFTNRDGSDRIGILLHSYPFRGGVVTMNNTSITYLPDNGSLGLRATEFDWQAVFQVNPIDYRHIIVPDIVNGVVKVTRDGGIIWTTDFVLTNLVTRNGSVKMYNGTPNIQVTHIEWDPYHNNRILVGTRENGVILSEDNGNTWRLIKYSPNMLFVTGFAFQPDNIAYVSTYGRGIWKIDFNVFIASPAESYLCNNCSIINPDLIPIVNPIFSNYSVIEVRGGEVISIGTGNDKKPELLISEKAFYKAWIPEKGNDAIPSVIRTKEQPDNNIAMIKKQCGGCAVTGVVLKGNDIIGYITHKEKIPLKKEDHATKEYPEVVDNGANEKEEGAIANNDGSPEISIASKLYVSGLPVIGRGDKLTIIVNDIKEIPAGSLIQINGVGVTKTAQASWHQEKNGYSLMLELPKNLSAGLQRISILTSFQKRISASFIIANVDEFEKNDLKNKKIIPEKEIIID